MANLLNFWGFPYLLGKISRSNFFFVGPGRLCKCFKMGCNDPPTELSLIQSSELFTPVNLRDLFQHLTPPKRPKNGTPTNLLCSIGFRVQAIFLQTLTHIDTEDLLGMLDISVLAWKGEPFEELLGRKL